MARMGLTYRKCSYSCLHDPVDGIVKTVKAISGGFMNLLKGPTPLTRSNRRGRPMRRVARLVVFKILLLAFPVNGYTIRFPVSTTRGIDLIK